MAAIEKIRIMTNWFNMQSEYFNEQFTSISQLEKIYDYALKNNLEFMDNDYLYSHNLSENEQEQALKFIKKVIKSK